MIEGKPDYMAGLMHSVHLWRTWSTLTDAVRAGTTVVQREAMNERGVNWLEAFIAAMHMRAYKQAPALVKLLDLRGVRRVLDVGGGSGAYSMAFVHARKGIHATVFDLPNVVPLTGHYIDSEKLADKISTVAGDYEADTLGTGFDLVFLSAIIHINSIESNKRLVKKAYDALNPNGQLVIQDHVMNDDRTAPLPGALFALNMLVGTHFRRYVHRVRDSFMDGGSGIQKYPPEGQSGHYRADDGEKEVIGAMNIRVIERSDHWFIESLNHWINGPISTNQLTN